MLKSLLRWLTSSETPSASYEREQDEPDPIDWAELENVLVRLAITTIERFAAEHPTEVFYGLGFDCHADYGQVLVCLNTREAQREAGDQDDDWSFGGWCYHGINLNEAWEDEWEEVPLILSNAANILLNHRKHGARSALYESFLEMATRALLRVARSDPVARLNKEPGFRALAMDHDEGPEAGFARLERLERLEPTTR